MSVVKSIKVKIRDVVDPRTFWVTEIKKMSVHSLKIKSIESRLEEQFANEPGEMISSLTEIGAYVAVKVKDGGNGKWRRGRLMNLFKERFLLATVFLMDYGIALDRVVTEKNVRILDASYLRDPPLAFQVVLKGLTPVTMDFDWSNNEDGMMTLTPSPSSTWDPAAMKYVRTVLDLSRLDGDLVDMVRDNSGRRHGTLKLNIEHAKVSLNELLIERKFALFSPEQFEDDLVSADHGDPLPYPLFLSAISELSEGSKPDDDEEEEADKHSLFITTASTEEPGTLEEYVKENPDHKRGKSFIFPSKDIRNDKDKNQQSRNVSRGRRFSMPASRMSSSRNSSPPRFETIVPINSGDSQSNNSQSSTSTSSQKLLEMLRRGSMTAKALQEEEEKEDVIDWGAIKKESHNSRWDPERSEEDTLSYFLPGGVTIGKYHENVLSHVLHGNSKSNHHDLKHKFEDFVTRNR